MFNFRSGREKELELTIKTLKDEKFELEKDIDRLKCKKKIEEEDIKHMVKIKEQKLEIDYEKKVIAFERSKALEVAKVKDDYRDKIEKNLHERGTELRKMYNEILQRLPNINVEMRGKVK